MTPDQPERQGRKRRGGLFVYDTEICERLGLPDKDGMRFLRTLDAEKRGLPPKIEALNGRRYWPAVEQFLDRAYGLQVPTLPLVSSRAINPQARKSA